MDAKEREELEAFARIEWPGVLMRVTLNGQPTKIVRVAADRLEEVEARFLALDPLSLSSSAFRQTNAPPTGAGTGRRKRGR